MNFVIYICIYLKKTDILIRVFQLRKINDCRFFKKPGQFCIYKVSQCFYALWSNNAMRCQFWHSIHSQPPILMGISASNRIGDTNRAFAKSVSAATEGCCIEWLNYDITEDLIENHHSVPNFRW